MVWVALPGTLSEKRAHTRTILIHQYWLSAQTIWIQLGSPCIFGLERPCHSFLWFQQSTDGEGSSKHFIVAAEVYSSPWIYESHSQAGPMKIPTGLQYNKAGQREVSTTLCCIEMILSLWMETRVKPTDLSLCMYSILKDSKKEDHTDRRFLLVWNT